MYRIFIIKNDFVVLYNIVLHQSLLNTTVKSFIYLTCDDWNSLSTEVRTTTSLDTFKRLIRLALNRIPSLVELAWYPSILCNHLKYGCSALNFDLHHANLIPDSICECSIGTENLFHSLYNYSFYNVQREQLISELTELQLTHVSLPILFECDSYLASEMILEA